MKLPIRLKFPFTLEDMRVSQKYHTRAHSKPLNRAALYVGAALLASGAAAMALKTHTYYLLIVPIVLFASLVVAPLAARQKVKREVAQRLAENDDVEYQIDERHLTLRRKRGEASSEWDRFTLTIQTPEGFLLYQGKSSFWLPQRAFESAEVAEDFAALARKKIKDFRKVE